MKVNLEKDEIDFLITVLNDLPRILRFNVMMDENRAELYNLIERIKNKLNEEK